MKKTLFRKVILFAAVFALLMPMAMADMQRGDKGDNVQQLQQMLFETGWLFEVPDGIFGRNTEQAVKDFEAYANLPVDGIADDQMVYELSVAWQVFMDEYNMSTEYEGCWIEPPEYPACCIQVRNAEGSYTQYCEIHQSMLQYTQQMLRSGDIEEVKQATIVWQQEAEALYDRWIDMVPEEEKGAVIANKNMFFANIDAQRRNGASGTQTIENVRRTENGIMQTLCSQVEWLCGMLWDLENLNGYEGKPIRLSSSTIIDGDTIYYSGSIDGENIGIYAMDLNGGNVRQILKGMAPSLEAVSNGNLFVYSYDWETALLIKADGEMKFLNEGDVEHYNGHVLVHDGYFYWNRYKIAEDGSDWADVIPYNGDNDGACYPVAIDGEYLYFLDDSEYIGEAYYEANILPPSAALSRVKFGTGVVEKLSAEGTRFMGIEDSAAYYIRQNFYTINYEGDFVEQTTDQGLYCLNLEEKTETQLTRIMTQDEVFEQYLLLKNGILYGMRSDYTKRTDGWGDMSIIRMTVDGHQLAPIALNNTLGMVTFDVVNGVYYGGYVEYMDEEYSASMDHLFMYSLKDGNWTLIALDNNATMFWGEFNPKIAVIDGKIYYEAMDNDTYTVQLRMIDMDEFIDTILAQGPDYY